MQLTCLRVTMGLRVSIDSCSLLPSLPQNGIISPAEEFSSLLSSRLTSCLRFSFRIIRSFVWIRLPRNLNKFHLPSVPISTQSRLKILPVPLSPRIKSECFRVSNALRCSKKRGDQSAREGRIKGKKNDPSIGRSFSPSTKLSTVKNYIRLKRGGENRYARFDLKYHFYWPNSLSRPVNGLNKMFILGEGFKARPARTVSRAIFFPPREIDTSNPLGFTSRAPLKARH